MATTTYGTTGTRTNPAVSWGIAIAVVLALIVFFAMRNNPNDTTVAPATDRPAATDTVPNTDTGTGATMGTTPGTTDTGTGMANNPGAGAVDSTNSTTPTEGTLNPTTSDHNTAPADANRPADRQ